jgi:uncharacterized Rmd1/YagE family protein
MIFWENEPNLHPLYSAVREYLEIKPRIQVLNERCRVFLDLAEILSDAIADKKMTSTMPTILACTNIVRYYLDHNHTHHHFDLCDLFRGLP